MKYIKLYEDYYTEEYDVVLYPGKSFIRVDSVLKNEILSVISGSEEFIEIPRDKYSRMAFKIYKDRDVQKNVDVLVFKTKEGITSTLEIEDVLHTFNQS